MIKLFSRTEHAPDYRFIIMLAVIVVCGLLALSSASAPTSFARYGDSYFLLKRQITNGVIPGVLLLLVLSKLDYRIFRKAAFPLLIFSIALLIAVLIPGLGADFGTARSWIAIFGLTFQPAELVKLTFLIYLASWLEARGAHRASNFSEGLVPFITVLGLIIVLIMLQPDLGTLIIIVAMSLAVYWVGGAAFSHVLGIVALGVAGILLLAKITPYRAARLTVFLHPELDPQGIGYHINQAFLAIGSGGLFGRGFGLSRQKYQYLPEVAGDSIFAIIAEELGFFLTALFLAAYSYLMYLGLRIAQRAPDVFGKLLAVGIISWFSFQAIINIGAMVGALPLTGVPLPFVSQGGTALAVGLAACGILINISKQSKA